MSHGITCPSAKTIYRDWLGDLASSVQQWTRLAFQFMRWKGFFFFFLSNISGKEILFPRNVWIGIILHQKLTEKLVLVQIYVWNTIYSRRPACSVLHLASRYEACMNYFLHNLIVQCYFEMLSYDYESNVLLVHMFSSCFSIMQVKCWQIRRQTKAPQAAGAIHTDFERGFICAEVIKRHLNFSIKRLISYKHGNLCFLFLCFWNSFINHSIHFWLFNSKTIKSFYFLSHYVHLVSF